MPGLVAGIRAGIATCKLCPAMRPWRKLPPESFGTTRTGYVLVAEAPGPRGDLFRDASGAAMREALAQTHDEEYTSLEDLFFLTHAVRCVPTDPKAKAKTRAPKRSADSTALRIARRKATRFSSCIATDSPISCASSSGFWIS